MTTYHYYDETHTYPVWYLIQNGYRDFNDGDVRWWNDDEVTEAETRLSKIEGDYERRKHRITRAYAISVFFPGQGVHAPSGSLDKETVKSNADIVEVYRSLFPDRKLVERYGRATAQAFCHDDRRPSMSLNREKGTWRCFVCNEGGDVISLVMRSQDVGFQEALKVIHTLC
ncbi:MAG: CHC2 zinc finger domain-containing protein [Sphaerochaeta sp.]|jgi:hypothetical protein|nr:CHC2 zinc finger domain-containing protein [Sphaerochaeta sp.]